MARRWRTRGGEVPATPSTCTHGVLIIIASMAWRLALVSSRARLTGSMSTGRADRGRDGHISCARVRRQGPGPLQGGHRRGARDVVRAHDLGRQRRARGQGVPGAGAAGLRVLLRLREQHGWSPLEVLTLLSTIIKPIETTTPPSRTPSRRWRRGDVRCGRQSKTYRGLLRSDTAPSGSTK